MTENELSKIIVNSCYEIHVELAPSLLESVYEEILFYELVNKALKLGLLINFNEKRIKNGITRIVNNL